jgi:hypothetical protein
MRTSDCGFPHTVQQWEALLRTTRKMGNTNAVCTARAYVTQVQNTHAKQCTEPQRQALKEWMYPTWFEPPARKGKECAAPKTVGCQASASPGRSSSQSPERAATSAPEQSWCLFPDLPLPHKDGWQPRHEDNGCLSTPMMCDVPEMWAAWIDQHPDNRLQGIVIMPDGHVSMRSIRGMQLIKRRNPRPGVVNQQWTQYIFLATQLFASPSAYWEAIRQLRLTVANSGLWNPYDGSIENLTINDLARFFAMQGMTEEEANNVFEYAYQWLTTATTQQISQAPEIQSLLGEVNLTIREAGNKPPLATSVQWWQPFFLHPAQLYAGQLPADERAALAAQYSPFDKPVEDSAILDLDHVGPIEASRHQSDPSDTVSLGHTNPESSISPPASRPMTHTTDPDSEMESGVALSVPPASSALHLPATDHDAHASLAQTSATLSSMSLTFVRHNMPIMRIDDPLYEDPYAQQLPYSNDTPIVSTG